MAQTEPLCGSEAIVQEGDWLGKVAEDAYGDPLLYPAIIYATNQIALIDPGYTFIDQHDIIEPGWKLCLPPADQAESLALIAPDDRNTLTVDQLENATYSLEHVDGAPFQLVNGEFESQPDPNGPLGVVVTLGDVFAFGDLNGDGREDAVVILFSNPGGSGIFSDLAVMLNRNGTPVQAASAFLGDRSPVKSINIVGDSIYVSYVTQGPDDPQCCPTQATLKKFQVQNGRLVELGSSTTTARDALSAEALRNATYQSEEFSGAETATLTEGLYIGEPFEAGAASHPRLTLMPLVVFGDVTGDGVEDAVTVITYNGGGSGTFYYLALVVDQDGTPTNIATSSSIGDRIGLKGLGIDNGQIVVNLITQGSGDAACCSTLEAVATFQLQDDQFVQSWQVAVLSADTLKNRVYSGIYDEPVKLIEGLYEGEPFVEGGVAQPTVQYIDNTEVYGDLTGSGLDDAAVLLVENSGGSGVFSYVGAQLNQDGQSLDGGAVLLGDRTQVISMAIEDGQVVVDIVTPGPDEPLCCGTLKLRKALALQDGKLAEVGSEELGTVSLDDLMDTSWALERLDFNQPVLSAVTVTAQFSDGQVTGLAGCNNYSASLSSDGGQNLTVGPTNSTQMTCPDPIMAQELAYLTALQNATWWSYFPGQLAIDYQNEDGSQGTLFFDPAGSDDSGQLVAADTEVITFVPTDLPTETQAGSCFGNAIGPGRENAWRCTVGNEIYDPCFAVGDNADEPLVVCGANPATGETGFVLELSEPLPAPDPGNISQPWLVELGDGQVCGLLTGTVPGVDGRPAPYACPDGSNLFDDFQQSRVWMAEKALIGLNENGFFIEQSETVPVSRIWQ
jgi:heat shock protein HslJ